MLAFVVLIECVFCGFCLPKCMAQLAFPPTFLVKLKPLTEIQSLADLEQRKPDEAVMLFAESSSELTEMLIACRRLMLRSVRIQHTRADYSLADLAVLLDDNPHIQSLHLSSPKSSADTTGLRFRSAGNLGSLIIRDAEIHQSEAAEISECKKLTAVDLTGCKFDELVVHQLLSSKSIETLVLDACIPTVDARGVAFRSPPTRCPLRHLSIERWEFSDAEWLNLVELPCLVSLRAGQVGNGAKFSESLRKLKGLRELHVKFSGEASRVNSEFFDAVSHLSSLETLGLTEPQLSKDCFSKFAELPNLSAFFLSRYEGVDLQVPSELFRQIALMSRLQSLSLRGDWVNEDVVKSLSRLKRLENLELKSGSVKEDVLIEELRFRPLRTISLEWIDLSESSIEMFRSMQTLEKIELLQSGLEDRQFAQLRMALPECLIIR